MALKNRRTQNKKSNKKRQQSKRGGTRKSVKKNRITVKRGGTSLDERVKILEGKMGRRGAEIESIMNNAKFMGNEIDTLKDDKLATLEGKLATLEGKLATLEKKMPNPMSRFGSS
mgnify:CR=1 FL=1